MALQREDRTPHWSKGDLVKVRSETADDWRDAYVLIQRGRNLLLVIPEGMIHSDGTRHTRLSLIAEEEPGAYHRSLDGVGLRSQTSAGSRSFAGDALPGRVVIPPASAANQGSSTSAMAQ